MIGMPAMKDCLQNRKQALRRLKSFGISTNWQCVCFKGYGGSGKTFLMQQLAKTLPGGAAPDAIKYLAQSIKIYVITFVR